MDASPSVTVDPVSKSSEPPMKTKKTVDLLFEMKQHKIPGEKRLKTAQQRFGKKRAQHRKRALDFILMADYVDHAFGLDKDELKKVIASNGHPTSSSSTPQVSGEHIVCTIGLERVASRHCQPHSTSSLDSHSLLKPWKPTIKSTICTRLWRSAHRFKRASLSSYSS